MQQVGRRGKPAASKKYKDGLISRGSVEEYVKRVVLNFILEEDVSVDNVEHEITEAIRECVTAMSDAHEQMQNNRREIEQLGKETRRLLSELKAA